MGLRTIVVGVALALVLSAAASGSRFAAAADVRAAAAEASAPIAESGVVAFARGGDIFVANVDGSGERNLTRVGVRPAGYPDVSPDGTMIAFDEFIGDGPDRRTVVMNVDGSGLHRIGNISRGGPARWSPDGSRIAYGGPPERRLDVVAPDGSGLRTVATDAREFGFSWSPDGREIAYGSENTLRAVDVNTGSSRTLAATAGASNIAWSPDGSKIAFMRFSGEIWLVGRDGSGLRKLFNAEFVGAPSWSPDSTQIAFPITQTYPADGSILTVDSRTGSAHQLTSSDFGEGSDSPSWSPDGSRIAYERERIGRRSLIDESDRDVWVMNADGSVKVEVTFAFPLGTSASEPEWVPGLTRIEPDVEIGATVAARPRRVLKMTVAVDRLVADQTHALFVSDQFGVWSIRTGRLQRMPGRCEILGDVAIAGERLVWVCGEEGLSFHHEWLQTATLARPRPVDVFHINYSGLTVAGGGSLIVFSTGRKIWRLEGRRRRLLRVERAVAWPLSVDARRVLLERKDGSLAVVDGDGRLVRGFHFAQRPLAAELAGDRLVVLRSARDGQRLQVFRLADGKRVRSLRTAGGGLAEFESASGRLAAYVVGIAIHVVDLMNGHDVVLRFPQQAGTAHARLLPSGLVYSVGEAYSARPWALGFIPRATLLSLLRHA